MLRAAAVAASVGLLLLAYPPVDLHAVAWIALVPLLAAARSVGVSAAFGIGVAWNLAFAFALIDALPSGVAAHFGQARWVAWGFSALVFSVNSCLHYGAALALYRALSRRFSLALPLLAGAAFAAAELSRARLFEPVPGIVPTPVGMLGGSQAGFDALSQIAALTGQYGITFLVVAVNAAVVEGARAIRDRTRARGAAAAAPVAALLTLAWLYGSLVLRGASSPAAPQAVALVQGNLDPGGAWEPERQGRNLDTYLRLTLSTFELATPRVVFWPEGALTFLIEDTPSYRTLIARVLSAADAQLVAGGPRAGDGRAYNTTFLIAASGDTLAHYDKQLLLPFAEFAPFEGIELQQRSFGPFRYWLEGGESAPLPTLAGRAGVLICNEVLLPQLAAQRVRAGAEYLVTPANDGWLAAGWLPWPRWGRLMLDAARLRAIETRRWVVRASTAGPSAVIDPWGRVRAGSEPGTAAVLLGAIEPRSDTTPYVRVGDAFGLACAGLALAGLVRRTRRDGYTPDG